MLQVLEEKVLLFSQPVFSEAFKGISEAISELMGNNFTKLEEEEMYRMLIGASISYVTLRNRVAEFKKRTGIPQHMPLAKRVSAYIHKSIFAKEPLLPDYLAYANMHHRMPGAITYAQFKLEHQKD